MIRFYHQDYDAKEQKKLPILSPVTSGYLTHVSVLFSERWSNQCFQISIVFDNGFLNVVGSLNSIFNKVSVETLPTWNYVGL